jgi:antitoxin MazE6
MRVHAEGRITAGASFCVSPALGCYIEDAPLEVIPGYTSGMKTAISLPDDTFEQATRRAEELGMSRSEFFARAAHRYLDELNAASLTQQIDEALQAAGADESSSVAVAAGRRRLAGEDGW